MKGGDRYEETQNVSTRVQALLAKGRSREVAQLPRVRKARRIPYLTTQYHSYVTRIGRGMGDRKDTCPATLLLPYLSLAA